MIFVATAGQVGSEAVRLLAERGEPVRVLVRDRDKATALAQAGTDVADDVPAILGRPARTFEQFVTDYAQAFS